VAIGTVADVVPLVHENRVIVRKGLELINHHPDQMPKSLQGFLNFLNLKGNIDTFHIGFVIGPRINAGGRIEIHGNPKQRDVKKVVGGVIEFK